MRIQTSTPNASDHPVLRPEDQWSLAASARGTAVHAVVGRLLAETRSPSPRRIDEAVCASSLIEGRPVIHRQMIRQHLRSAIGAYFRSFLPPDQFEFFSSGTIVDGCEFDLLWRDRRDGSILADELKSGVAGLRFGDDRLQEQLGRQLAAGKRAFACFRGVRVIVLADRSMSFFASADGTRMPLHSEVR